MNYYTQMVCIEIRAESEAEARLIGSRAMSAATRVAGVNDSWATSDVVPEVQPVKPDSTDQTPTIVYWSRQ